VGDAAGAVGEGGEAVRGLQPQGGSGGLCSASSPYGASWHRVSGPTDA
jgi:hypothetical protein